MPEVCIEYDCRSLRCINYLCPLYGCFWNIQGLDLVAASYYLGRTVGLREFAEAKDRIEAHYMASDAFTPISCGLGPWTQIAGQLSICVQPTSTAARFDTRSVHAAQNGIGTEKVTYESQIGWELVYAFEY